MERTLESECRDTIPGSKKRMDALTRVRWILATDEGRFVKVDSQLRVVLTRDPGDATVYDGRDNEELKCRFMEALLKVPLTVVLLD